MRKPGLKKLFITFEAIKFPHHPRQIKWKILGPEVIMWEVDFYSFMVYG
jgi:hypothetical protein